MEALRERFGKYHVLEKIAQGGMAEVYKVKTVGIAGFEKVQALKRILPHQAREAKFIRSFIDEARIAVELTHRNIVQVFDFGKADGELFLAMELIDGEDLRTVMTQIASRDALPPVPIAAYIISEVASGLDYAHRKADGYGSSLGIVHCDVSPSNVMLSVEGDIKILDFGIARATFSSALERRRLRGKPRYMAPEQTLGETPSAASDVFALGIIAWELMTGQPLYRGSALKEILEAVRRTVPARIDRINTSVPAEVADAIAKALSQEPAQRGTAGDLAGACARTAMPAGARALAKWLASLAAKPERAPAAWQPAVTTVFVRPGDPGVAARPAPARPQTRVSETISLPLPEPERAPRVPGSASAPMPDPERAPRPPGSASAPVAGTSHPHVIRAESSDAAWRPARVERAEPMARPERPAPSGNRGGTGSRPRGPLDLERALADLTAIAMTTPPPQLRGRRGREPDDLTPILTSIAPVPPQVRGRLDLEPADRTQVVITPPIHCIEVEPGERATIALAPRSHYAALEPVTAPQVRGRFELDLGDLTAVAAPPQPPTDVGRDASPPRRQPMDLAAALAEPVAPRQAPVATPANVPALWPAQWRDRWQHEPTPGIPPARAEPLPRSDTAANAVETERFTRWSDTTGELAAGNTSYDELRIEVEIEPDEPTAGEPASAAIGEAPIDDDLGVMAAGALAERRRIVIVAGLLTGASPDALRPITKSLGELAYRRGGVVLELAPGALVVAFGLEVAGEDDVAVAMGWALDAAAMARDTASEGDAAQVQIGARAGVATASSPAGRASHAAPTVTVARAPDTGSRIPEEAIAEARALAREAAPDRPLFVGGAGRLTSSLYSLRELPGRRAGRRGPALELLGPRGFPDRDRARLERRGTFVGRTGPLGELEVWLQRAIVAGHRISVLITGAAGIGKSRLIAELVARRAATGAPLQVTTTAASPASRLAPFSTVIDLYQAALGLAPARGRSARGQVVHRLHQVLTNAGMAAERARAITTDLDRAMELRDGVAVGARETADLRPRISAGLAAFRTMMARPERPALTVVEDVHLIDSASLEVLRHSLAVPAGGPELLVLTARPEGPAPPAVDVVLSLGDLAGAEVRALIIDRLGDAATPSAIATVLARGGGNPLFIEELAQAVRDAGAAEDVPASARDVVEARIDRLPAKAKTALRFAAVLGGAIRVHLLEELLGEDSLDRELDEVVAAGFLVRADPAGDAEGELAFARGLVREVVYESLSVRAQRDSHARVGRLLASRFFAGREEPPAAIAEHLERGGEPAGAAAFWLRAGRLALSASDAGAAIACFTRTLGLERELGVAPPTATSRARRREALAGREEAHRLQGDLAADPGDLDELAQLCADDPARLADVALRRAQRMLRLGDYHNASSATAIAEMHAIAAGDERLRGESLRVRSEILERVGEFDEALAVVGAARELFHRQHAVADEMAAMVGRGRIHLLRAHYEAARDAYRPVLALIDQTGDPWLERIVKNHVAVIEMCLGNFAVAMQCALRSLELCRRYGDRSREGDAQSVAGIVLLEVGLHDQAATMFAGALDILSRTNSRWSRADCLIYAGICEQRRGRSGGLPMLDEALAEARRLGARYLEAHALVARAGAHLRTGALTAAMTDAANGATVARDATLVGYEIQGLARHALALTRLGNRAIEASDLAHRALTLLDAQRYLEGSEEEVVVACATVLRAAGARDHAKALHERGRASARRKLAALQDPVWRAAYAAIPEIAELLGS